MSDQPEALRLADLLEKAPFYTLEDGTVTLNLGGTVVADEAAALLRRVHAEIAALQAECDALRTKSNAGRACVVATQGANERLRTECDALRAALKGLLARDQRNTCLHESTHRGGAIWEICDGCGLKWADDEGGKPEWVDPPEWDAAFDALKGAK